jgi:hypothetical protein
MKKLLVVPMLVLVAACPRDREERAEIPVDSSLAVDTAAADTLPDLSDLSPNIPAAAPDTFTPRQPRPPVRGSAGGSVGPSVPAAPEALMAAVEREQSFSRFCYQELGLKSDPSLAGNVAMVVTVGQSGITDARVGDANWSSRTAGSAVNNCLNERARSAWKLAPGAVSPGRYVVQLSFRGS